MEAPLAVAEPDVGEAAGFATARASESTDAKGSGVAAELAWAALAVFARAVVRYCWYRESWLKNAASPEVSAGKVEIRLDWFWDRRDWTL